jgi:hypothetical protein
MGMPLGPIGSLHYFLLVIKELLANPVPVSYVDYLRSKVTLITGTVHAPAARG